MPLRLPGKMDRWPEYTTETCERYSERQQRRIRCNGGRTVSVPKMANAVARSPAAERMRRSRERRRNGMRSVTVELREIDIDALIRKGLLQADARNNLIAVRNALHSFFDRTLSHVRVTRNGTEVLNRPDR
jgi:hypothetical protein